MLLVFMPPLCAQPPSIDLIEFIGQWQDVEGDWVDPMTIDSSEETSMTAKQQGVESEDTIEERTNVSE